MQAPWDGLGLDPFRAADHGVSFDEWNHAQGFAWGGPGDACEDPDAWVEARAAEHEALCDAWEERQREALRAREVPGRPERESLRDAVWRVKRAAIGELCAQLDGVAQPPQLRLDGYFPPGADPGAAGRSPCVSGNNWLAIGTPEQAEASGALPELPELRFLDRYPTSTYLGAVERLTEAPRGRRAAKLLLRSFQARERAGLALAEAARVEEACEAEAAALTESDPSAEWAARASTPFVWRMRRGRKVSIPTVLAEKTSEKWARDRSKGQRTRFEQLLHCGEGALQVRCTTGCGHEQATTVGCANRRLCLVCRDREAARQREEFARAREEAIRQARKLGLFKPFRPGGRYSEKHLTLTLPDALIPPEHGGATEWRIAVLFQAWRTFSQHLQGWLRTVQPCRVGCRAGSGVSCKAGCVGREGRRLWAHWFRGFEWTAGADMHGHPHFHVWLLCPFLPERLVRFWWALALQGQGVDVLGPAPAKPGRAALPSLHDVIRSDGRARMSRPDQYGARRVSWHPTEAAAKRRAKRSTGARITVEGPLWVVDAPPPPLPELTGRIVLRVAEVVVRRVTNGGPGPGASFAGELVKGASSIKGIPGRARLQVRLASGGQDLIAYIAGWLVSETDSNGVAVEPEVSAQLYEALEGRRQNQASRGFMAMGRREVACPCCGTVAHMKAQLVPWFDRQLDLFRKEFGLPEVRGPTAPRASPGIRRADARNKVMQLRLAV